LILAFSCRDQAILDNSERPDYNCDSGRHRPHTLPAACQ